MKRLAFIFTFLISFGYSFAQEYPHGDYFEKDCSLCHTDEAWKPLRTPLLFKHDSTGFDLTDQHKLVDCKTCHTTLVFENVRNQCNDCHTDMHENTNGPDCGRCHNFRSWIIEDVREIHLNGRFPLYGAHLTADCSSCHPSATLLRFEPLGIDCYECHISQYNGAPGHFESSFPKNCLMCHNNDSWENPSFDHDNSSFPLIGVHSSTKCELCHTSGYAGTSSLCVDCHEANYTETRYPNHTAAGIPTQCTDCHTPVSWVPSEFDHLTTGFELLGRHKRIGQCSECHKGSLVETENQCFSCHEVQYNRAPGHLTANFSKSDGTKPAVVWQSSQLVGIPAAVWLGSCAPV